MDHSTWSAYSQHLSRLGASMNPSSGSLSQASQLNDLPLPPTLPRQDHLGSYGNTAAPHHFLLAPSHGLNPSQSANRSDHSFGASGLFVANYDSSLLTAPFQSSNKGHLPAFPQGPGFFKAVGRDSDFADLRTGFSHCGMPPYGRNPDGNSSLPSAPALGTNALFPNSMSSSSWRPSGMMPSSCGPFGVLPHETVLQRSHLVRRSSEKQSSKSPRSAHAGTTYMEQDLSRGYRGILSSPARPPSSFMEHGNPNHSSLLSPQNDPYFSSVTDSYYNSCSKTDFAAYGSYCSNMPSGMPRGAISPYCYPQSFGTIESVNEKQEHSSGPNSVPSANSNFSNVPNSSYSHNTNYPQNGLMPRQTVITSSANTSATVSSQMQDSRMAYTQREAYNCSTGGNHAPNSLSVGNRPATAHSITNHHLFSGQMHYPPMSTPIPAATPAHPTPPSTMGQAHVPQLLAMNQDSGCSSMVYNSPTNSCYSTPGTSHSGSTSPLKQDLSQHSSPVMYPVESNNMRVNSSPFIDPNRMHQSQCMDNREMPMINAEVIANMHDNATDSSTKISVDTFPADKSNVVPPDHLSRSTVPEVSSVQAKHFQDIQPQNEFENHAVDLNNAAINRNHHQEEMSLPLQPEDLVKENCDLNGASSSPALDYTQKEKHMKVDKSKQDCIKTMCSSNFGYLEPSNHPNAMPPPSHTHPDIDKTKELNVPDLTEDAACNSKSDVPTLPVDLSHVSLNLSVKKEKTPEKELPKGTSDVEAPKLNYDHSLLSSEWPLESTNEPSSSQQPPVEPCDEPKKEDQQLCLASSLDDLSQESKNKLNNIDEDLGFLAELSATSEGEDGTSKEAFTGKKQKKKKKPGFLQTFLTFLENSNDAPSTSQTHAEKQGNSEKKESPKMLLFDNKNVENSWPLGKDLEKPTSEAKTKSGDDKIIDSQVQDKDTFEEAPSLDSGLFSCNTLQKEMVVPNPEAPQFSSDEDENSAQGIFDSVAMAIQRLCDDNDEDNHGKGESSCTSKTKNESSSNLPKQKISEDLESEDNDVSMEDANDLPPCSENAEEPVVPALIVRQKRGKRKKGHLLVIKVNHLKKPNVVVPPTSEESTKAKRKPLQSVRKSTPPESTSDNGVSRRPLMRKCKQKRFQKKSESKRKRKTRNAVKRKHEKYEPKEEEKVESLDEKPIITQRIPKVINIKNIPDNMKPTVKISIISPMPSTSTTVITEEIPQKIKKVSRKRQKKKRHHRQHKKPFGSSIAPPDSRDEETTNDVLPLASVSNDNLSMSKKPESSCSETNSHDNEVHFKTGDYVTLAENKEGEQIPIWRIVGKNVLQLFETFEDRDTSALYRNTTSYSRWSPSSKHKYSKLTIKVIKCDDDSVIIELAKKTDNKETSGISLDSYAAHPQRENFEVYLQTLVSHALDPDFIPEIVKENDEYFLTHLRAIEKITSEKKQALVSGMDLDSQFQDTAESFPDISIQMGTESECSACRLCQDHNGQYTVHFHGQLYNAITLENKVESPTCDWKYPLCGSCAQRVKLYNRLQHHKYHFYQLGCEKVKDVKKGDDKDSHAILEECLQDAKWMSQMFQDMMEIWNACDKFR